MTNGIVFLIQFIFNGGIIMILSTEGNQTNGYKFKI